jgi:hypothetical protein
MATIAGLAAPVALTLAVDYNNYNSYNANHANSAAGNSGVVDPARQAQVHEAPGASEARVMTDVASRPESLATLARWDENDRLTSGPRVVGVREPSRSVDPHVLEAVKLLVAGAILIGCAAAVRRAI